MTATEKPAPPEIHVGDIVTRSAKGKQYVVADFWNAPYGERMASLTPVEGYTSASAAVSQLTRVDATERSSS